MLRITTIILGLGLVFQLSFGQQAGERYTFDPGKIWYDTDGNPINAHGGGMLYHQGYVWLPVAFEEDRPVIRWKETWDLDVFNNP